jgi:dTDP-4-dehydrorhamnose reductase
MRVLIIGADGQLGTDLCRVFKRQDLVPLTQSDIEITDMGSVQGALANYQPDVVINTAAFIRVDDCEIEKDKAYQVNALGARNVAVQSRNIGAKLVHISTDYVFGGEAPIPQGGYTEFEKPIPLNLYGRSKLAGEEMVQQMCHRYFIVRSSGLFGIAGAWGKGGNFIETILKMAREKSELKVVYDQVFSPTSTSDLAVKISQIINTEYYGIFHITNRGSCSWYEFAREILRLTELNTPMIPIPSALYPQKAKRPHYSVLRNYQLKLSGLGELRSWPEALRDYLKEKGHLA